MIVLFVKTTLILVIVSIVTALMRRSSAASRHLVWTCGLLAVVFLPVASALLPALPLPLLRPSIAETVLAANTSLPEMQVFEAVPAPAFPDPSPSARGLNRTAATPAAKSSSSWPWLAIVWALGTAIGLTRAVFGLLLRTRLQGRCRPTTDERIVRMTDAAARAMGIRRRVVVLMAPTEMMPATWGLRQPKLLLPPSASTWTDERLRVVLVHELAHITRFDVVAATIARAATALAWWNPLVWLATSRAQLERERACDDTVLRAGVTASVYAEELLAIAQTLPSPSTHRLALAMARPNRLSTRVSSILDATPRRTGTSRTVAIAAGALLAAQWPLAAATLVPAGTTPGRTERTAVSEERPAITTQAPPVRPGITAPRPSTSGIAQRTTAPAPGTVSGFLFGAWRNGNIFHNDLNERLALATPRLLTRHLPFRQKASPQSGPQPIPAGTFGEGAYRPGNGVTNPIRIREVKPVYTDAALKAGLQGSVELEAVIAVDGTVADVRVVRSLDDKLGLDENAKDVVRRTPFVPCKIGDKPVACLVVFELQFTPGPPTPIAAGQFGAGAYRPGNGVTNPLRNGAVTPRYTKAAMDQKIEGTVELEAVVGSDGAVTDVRIVRSLDKTFGLDESAMDSVRRTAFTPCKLADKPVACVVVFELQFTLR